MKYHLIATTTLTTSLKGAREFNSEPRPPVMIMSGSFDECYNHAVERILPTQLYHDREIVRAGNLPLCVLSDWTYWVLKEPKT